MSSVEPQQPIWRPSPEQLEATEMTAFMRWAAERHGRQFAGYGELWQWSVSELEQFWADIWEFCGVRASEPYEQVLRSHEMPGTAWFEGARLNYAENLIAGHDPSEVAVVHCSELRELEEMSWGELEAQVAAAAAGLRSLGVERGDRVVAYMPNIPETLVAFLASASIGAIWSSAAPEFGARSVIDRFAQIEPKVFLTVDGYRHGGKDFDRSAVAAGILAELGTVVQAVVLPYLDTSADPRAIAPQAISWSELLATDAAAGLRVRAGPVRPPALGPLLLGHDRAAEGDRPGPRRHTDRAAQEADASRSAQRRPDVLVHHDRMDDVELPGRLPAQRGGDRPL